MRRDPPIASTVFSQTGAIALVSFGHGLGRAGAIALGRSSSASRSLRVDTAYCRAVERSGSSGFVSASRQITGGGPRDVAIGRLASVMSAILRAPSAQPDERSRQRRPGGCLRRVASAGEADQSERASRIHTTAESSRPSRLTDDRGMPAYGPARLTGGAGWLGRGTARGPLRHRAIAAAWHLCYRPPI